MKTRNDWFVFATADSDGEIKPLCCVSRQWKNELGCQTDRQCLKQALTENFGKEFSFVEVEIPTNEKTLVGLRITS